MYLRGEEKEACVVKKKKKDYRPPVVPLVFLRREKAISCKNASDFVFFLFLRKSVSCTWDIAIVHTRCHAMPFGLALKQSPRLISVNFFFFVCVLFELFYLLEKGRPSRNQLSQTLFWPTCRRDQNKNLKLRILF